MLLRKSLFAIIFLTGFIFNSSAQDITYYYADSLSYKLYSEGQYKELISLGDNCTEKQIDFYYFDMRLGIANYELKRYFEAKPWFEKALNFNSVDTLALEYLYYCYVFSNKQKEAELLADQFPASLKRKINHKNKSILRSIDLNSGSLISPNITTPDIDDKANNFGEYDKSKNLYFSQFGIESKLGPQWYLYNSASYCVIDKEKYVAFKNKLTTSNYFLNQIDYFMNVQYLKDAKWSFNATGHYINISSASITGAWDQGNRTYKVIDYYLSMNDYLFSIGAKKNAGKNYINYNLSLGKINTSSQFQLGIGGFYYPFKKQQLYAYSSASVLFKDAQPKLMANQMIGIKLNAKLFAEANVWLGSLKNFSENNGTVIYNLADDIKLKTGLSISYLLNKHLTFNLQYGFLQREGSYYYYTSPTTYVTKSINYNQQSITLGIKWKL